MLQFPKNYFDTEIRDGFCISELMKRAWAAQLEILQKIIGICDKYQITYYAYWGSLLGAVRHQGFIPWDDDLDIAMKRDDYIRFLEVAAAELPENYCILNAYTEDEYENCFSRVTNGHEIDLSESRLSQYHGCPFVMGIDIFPLYYIPRDQRLEEHQREILNLIGLLTNLLEYKEEQEQLEGNSAIVQDCRLQIAQGLVSIEQITGYHFEGNRPLKTQLEVVFDQVCRLAEEEESDYLTIFPDYLQREYKIPKELLKKVCRLPFENIMINVPAGYKAVLEICYHDYMKPIRRGGSHGYPFYEDQLHMLGQYIEKKDLEYRAAGQREKILCQEELPQAWREKIYELDENGIERRKKIVLYYAGADALLCNGGIVPAKLRAVLDTFQEESGIVLWWFPCLLNTPYMSAVKQMVPGLVSSYQQILEDYRSQNWGIYDDTGDIERAIAMSDAYYGDEGEVFRMYRETGKWIMVQDYKTGC